MNDVMYSRFDYFTAKNFLDTKIEDKHDSDDEYDNATVNLNCSNCASNRWIFF